MQRRQDQESTTRGRLQPDLISLSPSQCTTYKQLLRRSSGSGSGQIGAWERGAGSKSSGSVWCFRGGRARREPCLTEEEASLNVARLMTMLLSSTHLPGKYSFARTLLELLVIPSAPSDRKSRKSEDVIIITSQWKMEDGRAGL